MSTGFEAVMGYLHLTGELPPLEGLDQLVYPWKKEESNWKISERMVPSGEVTDHPNPPAGYGHTSAGPSMVATEGRRANQEKNNYWFPRLGGEEDP